MQNITKTKKIIKSTVDQGEIGFGEGCDRDVISVLVMRVLNECLGVCVHDMDRPKKKPPTNPETADTFCDAIFLY